jgi:hypothetical protein
MRPKFSCFLVAFFLPCFLSSCSQGYSRTDAKTVFSQPPATPTQDPPVPTVVSNCGTIIASPGTYVLNSILVTNVGVEPCITINNTHGVILNCGGHSIVGLGQSGIAALNDNGIVVENCNVATGTGQGNSSLLYFKEVNGAQVTGSTFGSNQSNLGGVFIFDSINVTFGSSLPSAPSNPTVTVATNPAVGTLISNAPQPSNVVYGFLQNVRNVNLIIEGNAVTSATSTTTNPFAIGAFGGRNTRVINNTVNGLGSPVPIQSQGIYYTNNVGTDDDILIEDETGPDSLFSGNILVNTWDAGIETVGFIRDATISNNYIDTVNIGIGGWYYFSAIDTHYLQNVLTNIEYWGFYFARFGGLRPAGSQNLTYFFYTTPSDTPAETAIYFTQNVFSGNIVSQPIGFEGRVPGSLYALVYSKMGYAAGNLPGTQPTEQQFVTNKNTFANNIFDEAFSPLYFSGGLPWTYTSDDVIDGGGNICAGSLSWVPTISPTFSNQVGTTTWISPITCSAVESSHITDRRFGSDTGIRTRVSAVRGRRPGPLDDIANVGREKTTTALY